MNLSPPRTNPGGIFFISDYTVGMPIPNTIANGNQHARLKPAARPDI